VEPSSLLSTAGVDGRALLTAAEVDWACRVPHCPEWDTAGLVRHTGGIFDWMAAIVSSGDRVSRRTLSSPPEGPGDLAEWYLASLDRVLAVLGSADPGAAVWTFSTTGDQRVGWWWRRLAVEVAVHRWDAQHATAPEGADGPVPIDGEVAAAGIEEYVVEFLPGLVAQDGVAGLRGSLQLHATDGPVEWWVDLDGGGPAVREHANAGTTVSGTRSDILLWLTNRGPVKSTEVFGDGNVAEAWAQLRR
jgi:uncharacterized protein (TIGR03083 family)